MISIYAFNTKCLIKPQVIPGNPYLNILVYPMFPIVELL